MRGAILIGIIVVDGVVDGDGLQRVQEGIFSAPPSLAPTFLKLDILGALHSGFVQHVILVFVLVRGVRRHRHAGGRGQARRPGAGRQASTAWAAPCSPTAPPSSQDTLGTSSTTAFVESASGVQAGGRTGMTALVVALLFPGRTVHFAVGRRRAGLRRPPPALSWPA